MSSDSKFFIGVVAAVVLAVAGIVFFSKKNSTTVSGDLSLLTETEHKIGLDEAPIKIVKFSDFECPACAAAAAPFKQIQQEFPEEVQIFYRHFPLPIHKHAVIAAIAAEAAANQAKFWEMNELLFLTQKEWSDSGNPINHFIKLAEELGLDTSRFQEDLRSNELRQKVNKDKNYSGALGLNQTPTFFVNQEKVVGAKSIEDWREIVAEARKNLSF